MQNNRVTTPSIEVADQGYIPLYKGGNLRCNNCSYGCTSKKANLVYNPDILKKDILYVEHLLANNPKSNQGACLQGGETLLYPYLYVV